MAEFHDRDLFLIKKALAIAVLVIEANDGPFQAFSDMTDMKDMMDRLIGSDHDMADVLRAARIQITGRPE
jgi:hypothetical protein